jgi:hypothetical protein
MSTAPVNTGTIRLRLDHCIVAAANEVVDRSAFLHILLLERHVEVVVEVGLRRRYPFEGSAHALFEGQQLFDHLRSPA